MIPRFFTALAALALVAIAAASADAQHYRRGCYTPTYNYAPCYSNHCYPQPSYSNYCQTYPIYGAWQWAQWETDPAYWVKNRWVTYSACDKRFESDGYLYIKTHCGFDRALLKADYHVQHRSIYLQPEPRVAYHGSTAYGYDPFRYAVAKHYGPGPALLLQQAAPSPLDVAALLPPPATERAARIEHAGKSSTSAADTLKAIALADIESEKAENETRRQIALQANQLQAFERMLGKFSEMAAVAGGQATVSGTASRSLVDVPDPELATLISTKCIECHGGGSVKGGIDFRDARSFKAKQWGNCWAQVKAGAMPDGGQRLAPAEVAVFERMFDVALKAE